MDRDYSVSIRETSKELSKVERIALKDVTNCVKLDMAVRGSDKIIITPVMYAILDIHNENAKDDKDYSCYIIVDNDGTKYVTGSKSFWNAFVDIYEEMDGDPFSIEAYSLPSKNYTGKDFLTCSIVMN